MSKVSQLKQAVSWQTFTGDLGQKGGSRGNELTSVSRRSTIGDIGKEREVVEEVT